jgi:hypothetical protein
VRWSRDSLRLGATDSHPWTPADDEGVFPPVPLEPLPGYSCKLVLRDGDIVPDQIATASLGSPVVPAGLRPKGGPGAGQRGTVWLMGMLGGLGLVALVVVLWGRRRRREDWLLIQRGGRGGYGTAAEEGGLDPGIGLVDLSSRGPLR